MISEVSTAVKICDGFLSYVTVKIVRRVPARFQRDVNFVIKKKLIHKTKLRGWRTQMETCG
jgi:hypothetical protein